MDSVALWPRSDAKTPYIEPGSPWDDGYRRLNAAKSAWNAKTSGKKKLKTKESTTQSGVKPTAMATKAEAAAAITKNNRVLKIGHPHPIARFGCGFHFSARPVAHYGWGVGVSAVLGGSIGYVTCGCSPVSDLR